MNSIFDKITFHQIKTLIDIIITTSGQDYEFIKNNYQLNAENFEEIIFFFKGLGLIRVDNNEIILTKNFKSLLNKDATKDSLIKVYLLERILNSSHSFTDEVFEYLNNFKVLGDAFEYRPITENRLKESGIRNFFIELDLIHYDRTTKSYKITDKYFCIFTNYADKRELTPKELLYLTQKQEELGNAAELNILEFEKKRLANYPYLLRYLKHISILDVTAGYDIKSCEIELINSEIPKPRYIEVKAVSKFNFKFYWTRNEVEKSKCYGNQYYLYLLPVIKNKKFDIGALEIIQNPFEKVLKNNANWGIQEERYSIWKKKIE